MQCARAIIQSCALRGLCLSATLPQCDYASVRLCMTDSDEAVQLIWPEMAVIVVNLTVTRDGGED